MNNISFNLKFNVFQWKLLNNWLNISQISCIYSQKNKANRNKLIDLTGDEYKRFAFVNEKCRKLCNVSRGFLLKLSDFIFCARVAEPNKSLRKQSRTKVLFQSRTHFRMTETAWDDLVVRTCWIYLNKTWDIDWKWRLPARLFCIEIKLRSEWT